MAANTQRKDFFLTFNSQYALFHNVKILVRPKNANSIFTSYLTQAIAVKNPITINTVPTSLHIFVPTRFSVSFPALTFTTTFIVSMSPINDAKCKFKIVSPTGTDLTTMESTHSVTRAVGQKEIVFELMCEQFTTKDPALVPPYITVTDTNANATGSITTNSLTYSIYWPATSASFPVTLRDCMPVTTANATLTYTDGGYGEQQYKSNVTYSCIQGHVINIFNTTNSALTESKAQSYLRQCDDIAWKPYNVDVTCVPNDCGPLDPAKSLQKTVTMPPVTFSTGNTKYTSIATYNCEYGWDIVHTPTFINPDTNTLMDKGKLYCTGTGWSDSADKSKLPACTPHECPFLSEIYDSKGIVYTFTYQDTSKPRFGDTAKYECAAGFKLSGDSVRICGATGWNSTQPSCLPETCQELQSLKNSKVPTYSTTKRADNTFADGTEATYACQSGYYLSNTTLAIRLCNKGWQGTPPSCLPQACPVLTTVTKGLITQTGGAGANLLGSTATYTCDLGYRITISSTGNVLKTTARECLPNTSVDNGQVGQWSGNDSD